MIIVWTFRIKDKEGTFELVPTTIDYENKELIFELDMDLLKVGQDSINFDIIAANIPYQSFIAAEYNSVTHPALATFMATLEAEREANPNRVASVNYPPSLISNFVDDYPHLFELNLDGKYEFRQGILDNELTVTLGQFMIYSEASLDDQVLFNVPEYKTLYNVKIILRRSNVNIAPTAYIIDSAQVNPTPALAETIWLSSHVSESLKVNHHDYNSTLIVGSDIKEYIELYYHYIPSGQTDEVSVLVDPKYTIYYKQAILYNKTGTFSFWSYL